MKSSPQLLEKPWRPTRAQLEAARTRARAVPDIIAPGLKVLFCGINPGLYSGAVRHHFARPGNRFWPALHAGGFTPRLLSPFDEQQLLEWGYGITNIVARSTAIASELSSEELRMGAKRLRRKLRQFQPRICAVVGIQAYRIAFDSPDAELGPQPELIGKTLLWVLPNPSGLNAHYQPAQLGELFATLRAASDASPL